MTPDAKPIDPLLQPIRDHLNKPECFEGLKWWHELGRLILEWKSLANAGPGWVKCLSDKFDKGVMSDDRVRRPITFAKSFNQSEVSQLVIRKVKWSHVRAVQGWRRVTKKERMELLLEAGRNEWTVKALNDEKRRRDAAAGVPDRKTLLQFQPKTDKDYVDAIQHLGTMTRAWRTVHRNGAWCRSIEEVARQPERFQAFKGLVELLDRTTDDLKYLIEQSRALCPAVANLRKVLAAAKRS